MRYGRIHKKTFLVDINEYACISEWCPENNTLIVCNSREVRKTDNLSMKQLTLVYIEALNRVRVDESTSKHTQTHLCARWPSGKCETINAFRIRSQQEIAFQVEASAIEDCDASKINRINCYTKRSPGVGQIGVLGIEREPYCENWVGQP